MKKILFTLCILQFAICTLHSLPSFPGAEGWGAQTPGGRGGKVYVVTNLSHNGPGSFNEAFRATESRIIVFRVSGVIPIQNASLDGHYGWKLNAENLSYVTVAGQTSPGGVTLTADPNYGSSIITQYGDVGWHDGIFRFLRFRCTQDGEGTISFYKANSFILDHCDFSGGTDETTDCGYSHHYTLQWCTIANSQPSSGNWGGSILWASPNNYISLHHNLWAHHRDRLPSINWYNDTPDFGMIDFVNNIAYDWQSYSFSLKGGVAGSGATEIRANCVGNYYKAGPANDPGYNHPSWNHGTTVQKYASENIWQKSGSQPVVLTSSIDNRYASDVSARWDMPQVTTYAGLANFDSTLNKVGAFPRDAMNIRTIGDVRTGTGVMRKIDDPLITSGPAPPADADNDGMPDFWEDGMGFDKSSAADNNGDHDSDGYTNIEEYINDLALARLCEDYYNQVYPVPQGWSDYDPSCCRSLALERKDAGFPNRNGCGLAACPNPFKPSTVISIKMPCRQRVSLDIFDVRGKLVSRVFSGELGQGSHGLNWEAKQLSAGMYLAVMQVGSKITTKRLMLLN